MYNEKGPVKLPVVEAISLLGLCRELREMTL